VIPSLNWAQSDVYVVLDTVQTREYVAIWYTHNGEIEVTATLAPIVIQSSFKNQTQRNKYNKLQKKVVKVYPYARAAAEIMRYYETRYANISDQRAKKAYLEMAESQMKAQFEKDLRELTVSEGVILIKLIDRETGQSSYELVRDLKGKMSAFMWQGLARVFGHNLKDTYEAEGEDALIESIVESIEDGSIPVQLREVQPF
jgi:hypothetical protein